MHIKDEVAKDLYEKWDLDSRGSEDILSAIAEAYMKGAMNGGMDSSIFEEALDFFKEDTSYEVIREGCPHRQLPRHAPAVGNVRCCHHEHCNNETSVFPSCEKDLCPLLIFTAATKG